MRAHPSGRDLRSPASNPPVPGGHEPRLVAALESEATERLRALDTAKDDFVTTASHELRTPLTSIVAYAELLRDEADLTTRQTRFVASIERNADRLAKLVDDLLLLSSFDSPQQQMVLHEVDLREVVASAAEVTEVLRVEKDLDVSLELPDHPVLVTGDAGHLERVVVNLLTNAIKFTDAQGSVMCRLATSASEVVLAVIDTGIGIPVAEREELFTKFFRGSAARDGAAPGTGLGLHIVASIVRNHGGDVSVESAAGQGTSFSVRLPRRLDGEVPAEPGIVATRAESTGSTSARFVALLSLPHDDPEVDDIATMLDAALDSARRTDQWELLGDALRFAHGRLGVRGLTDAGFGDIGAALVDAATPRTDDDKDRLPDLLARCVTEPADLPPEATGLGPSAAAYVDHLLRGDRAGAIGLTRRCITEGMDASEILLDILEPAQHEVGRRWALGHISVVQEHFCTAVTEFVMTDLYPGVFDGESSERRLLAVHAPGSLHHVGLRMVTDVLECQGWSTTYVSDNPMGEALIALLLEVEADLLLVSASMPGQIRHVSAMIRDVRKDPRTREVKVVVGGRPFRVAPDLVDAVGADGWALDARSAVDVCNGLTGVVSAER